MVENRSSGGARVGWRVAQSQWPELVAKFQGTFNLSRIVQAFGALNDPQDLKSFSIFFRENDAPTAERAVKQTIER